MRGPFVGGTESVIAFRSTLSSPKRMPLGTLRERAGVLRSHGGNAASPSAQSVNVSTSAVVTASSSRHRAHAYRGRRCVEHLRRNASSAASTPRQARLDISFFCAVALPPRVSVPLAATFSRLSRTRIRCEHLRVELLLLRFEQRWKYSSVFCLSRACFSRPLHLRDELGGRVLVEQFHGSRRFG